MNASPRDSAGLSAAQRAALAFAERTAKRHEAEARERVDRVFRHSGCGQDDLVRAMHSVRDHGRIVVHFHPDRYGTEPLTVAESLVEDGRYRNQFETGLSAGSRPAFPGGSRDRWERDLFGGAYHRPEVRPNERPKYGALELVRDWEDWGPPVETRQHLKQLWHVLVHYGAPVVGQR